MFQKVKEIQGHAGAIYTCAYDGKFLYTGSADKFVTRWNLEEGTQDKFAIKFEQSIYALAIHKHKLFVGLANGALHVFDLNNRTELKHFVQHKEALFSIKVDPSNHRVYAGDADGNLSVWDSETLELEIYLPLGVGKIRDIAISQYSDIAISGQDGTVRIIETEYFNEIATIKAHKDGATAVLFNPLQSEELITGGKDAHIRNWNWKTGEMLLEIPAHNFAVYRLITVGEALVSISRDKTVKVWNQKLGFSKRLDFKEGGHRHSVNDAIALDASTFATVGDDKRIIVWGTEEN
jgi:WD40 repeat protein